MSYTIKVSEAEFHPDGEDSHEPLIQDAREVEVPPRSENTYGYTIQVVEVESLEAIFDALETTNQIVLSPADSREPADYEAIIYNDWLE